MTLSKSWAISTESPKEFVMEYLIVVAVVAVIAFLIIKSRKTKTKAGSGSVESPDNRQER